MYQNYIQQINEKCLTLPITRNFYKKYFFKLEFHLQSTHILVRAYRTDRKTGTLLDAKHRCKTWDSYRQKFGHKIDADETKHRNLMLDWLWQQPIYKVRAEASDFAVYFEKFDDVKAFLQNMPSALTNRLKRFYYPLSEQTENLTREGFVLVKRPIPQKFLVTLSGGYRTTEETTRLYNYLKSIDAKFSRELEFKLTTGSNRYKDGRYFDSIRFYVHEDTHVAFICLMLNKVKVKICEVKLVS